MGRQTQNRGSVAQPKSELGRKNGDDTEILRQLATRLLHDQDSEHRRIARQLHDSAGQMLVAVQMNLLTLKASADANSAASIKDTLLLIDSLSRELRILSYHLHPPLLDEAGLPAALRWYLEAFAERNKIDVALEAPSELGRFPSAMEMAMFRIVQEALDNIHRHTESKSAKVTVLRDAEAVTLRIEDSDDGRLAKHSSASQNGKVPKKYYGLGVQGMRERVQQLGGSFAIRPENAGTLVEAVFSLADEQAH